jgi:hypothetical protein
MFHEMFLFANLGNPTLKGITIENWKDEYENFKKKNNFAVLILKCPHWRLKMV